MLNLTYVADLSTTEHTIRMTSPLSQICVCFFCLNQEDNGII